MLSALKPKNVIFTCLKYKYMTSILQQRAFSRTRSERTKYEEEEDAFPTENGAIENFDINDFLDESRVQINEVPSFQHSSKEKLLSIGICGAPNAGMSGYLVNKIPCDPLGKSTLINNIIGQTISAVSPKRNTTRSSILGVKTIKNTQLLFFDTPGLVQRGNKNKDEKGLMSTAESTLSSMDVCLNLIDSTTGFTPLAKDVLSKVMSICFMNQVGLYIALNKVDQVNPKTKLLPLAQEVDAYVNETKQSLLHSVSTPTVFQESFTYRYLYMISGMDNDGVDDILRQFQQDALPSQWLYSKDTTTPEGYHGIISEILREKVFLTLHKEIPYRINIVSTSYKETENSIDASYVFIVKHSHHRQILNSALSVIKKKALYDIQKDVPLPLNLNLQIQVHS